MSTCPRCSILFDARFPALSRRDNLTSICSDCGALEACEDAGMAPPYTGKPYATAPKVTWKKARLIPTREGIRTEEVE